MLDKPVVDFGTIDERAEFSQVKRLAAELLGHTTIRSVDNRLPHARMRAARIGPQAPRVILGHRPLGEKQLVAMRPFTDEHDRERAMQRAVHMRLNLCHRPNLAIEPVNENQQIVTSGISSQLFI